MDADISVEESFSELFPDLSAATPFPLLPLLLAFSCCCWGIALEASPPLDGDNDADCLFLEDLLGDDTSFCVSLVVVAVADDVPPPPLLLFSEDLDASLLLFAAVFPEDDASLLLDS